MPTATKQSPQECPRCRLWNEPGVAACDCGYNFTSKRMETPRAVATARAAIVMPADFARISEGVQAYRRLIVLVSINVVVGVSLRLAPHALHPYPGVRVSERTELMVSLVMAILLAARARLNADPRELRQRGGGFASEGFSGFAGVLQRLGAFAQQGFGFVAAVQGEQGAAEE
jgi:hypothetical protein